MHIGLSIPQVGHLADRDAGAHERIVDFSATAVTAGDVFDLADRIVAAGRRAGRADTVTGSRRPVTVARRPLTINQPTNQPTRTREEPS